MQDTFPQSDPPTTGALAVPDHELLGPIASGAYGEVWLARNVVGTLRAAKIVRRDRHASAESFEREFKGLQKFEPVSRAHEGLVDILTLGLLPDDVGFYYVMELADGVENPKPETRNPKEAQNPNAETASPSQQSVQTSGFGIPSSFDIRHSEFYSPRTLRADLKSRGALPADEVLALGLKLTAALAHLHAHGLVHRDVKPSNILFIGGEPKLADAGLVAAVEDARSLVGTAGYIAPEGPGTPQADLYALGKVLYEAAFGKDRQEFPALPADVASRSNHARLLELNAILLKACATNRRERYQSADEMRADVERLVRGGSVTKHNLQVKCLRYALVVSSGAIVLAILIGVVGHFVSPPTPRRQDDWTRWTTNHLAWVTYKRAGDIGNNLTYETHTNALAEYERAVAMDPNFAYARAEMALQMVCNGYGGMPAEPALARAKAEANRALAQDSTLSTAWHALAIAAAAEHDLAGTERNYSRALQSNPKDPFSLMDLATFLAKCGRFTEARGHLKTAQSLNPSWPNTPIFLGQIEMLQGHFEEAIRLVDSGIALQPTRASGYFVRGDIRWVQGKREEAAVDWLLGVRRSEVSERVLSDAQDAVRAGGPTNFLKLRIDYFKQRQASGERGLHYDIAVDQARLGQREEALRSLELAVDDRLSGTLWVNVSPEFQSFRDEPRFQEVLRRLGFQGR